jgi:hypothetical protein
LAAGIRRVKGVKKLGVRLGNWLTADQAQSLWLALDRQHLKGKRDRALLALLLACGLRRHEAVTLTLDPLQQREEHWAIVDLLGKAGHVRTVPVPDWVKRELDEWLAAAAVDQGMVFRRVNRVGRTWGDGMTEKSVWHIVKKAGSTKASPALTVEKANVLIAKGVPASRNVSVTPHFQAGQRVRARNIHPVGHTGLPRYARGKLGMVERDHGVFVFPDTNAQFLGEKPQHLYSVRFAARELWEEQPAPHDSVYINLWDDYLEPA